MTKHSILVVDDEADIQELVSYNLTKNGMRADVVGTGEDALRKVRVNEYDLVILDLMLPGLDGLEVCKRLKSEKKTAEIPVVMLSARGEEADVVVGLELGADDYVTKPFSPRVLIARVKAVLRRRELAAEPALNHLITRGPLTIDQERHEMIVSGQRVLPTALEMRILAALARQPGRVMTRYQIVEATQGVGVGVTDRSVDVHIVSLRKKLGDHAHLIETVRGVGYRFAELDD